MPTTTGPAQQGPGRSDESVRDGRRQDQLDYYANHTAQIEIVRHDRAMEQIVFPIPEMCEYLTGDTKVAALFRKGGRHV